MILNIIHCASLINFYACEFVDFPLFLWIIFFLCYWPNKILTLAWTIDFIVWSLSYFGGFSVCCVLSDLKWYWDFVLLVPLLWIFKVQKGILDCWLLPSAWSDLMQDFGKSIWMTMHSWFLCVYHILLILFFHTYILFGYKLCKERC